MKSKIIQKDHEDLINLTKAMTPEERLEAFYEHSRLLTELYKTGKTFLRNSSQRKN